MNALRSNARRCTLILPPVVFAMLLFLAGAAGAATVAIVIDGPTERPDTITPLIRREVADLLGSEFTVDFPADKQFVADWTLEGVRTTLQRALADPQVDVVVTLGLISSNEAAQIDRLPKPVIATVVPDATLQGFPLRDGASGRRNFTYISGLTGIDQEIATYHEVVGFRHLTVIADGVSIRSIPKLRSRIGQLSEYLDIEIAMVAAGSSVEQILAGLPAQTEAVFVAPLHRLPADGIERLAAGLVARKLPSLSMLGRSEVDAGLLMTIGGLPADDTRFARRIGLNLQRILLGEDAGRIEVGFRLGRRLVINMHTARAIGYLPRWAVLIDAERLYDEEVQAADVLTFADAMREAVVANLSYRVSEFDTLIAAEDVRSARAAWLPRLDLDLTRAQIDADRANPLLQSEKSTDARAAASQLVYSEQARSALAIAHQLEAASQAGHSATLLDTLQSASTAYLTLLRARALEAVRISNLEVTRTNLELARVRESIGASGRADVLRWETQIAGDRQQLLAAQAQRQQARTDLNRVLNRPQGKSLVPVRDGLEQALAVLGDPRFNQYVGNPVVWETFIAFSAAEAVSLSPELQQQQARVGAQQRDVLAARRAWYVPDVALSASTGNNLSRGGAGSDLTGLMLDDTSWTVALNASIPVFSGGALRARLSRAQHELARLQQQYAASAEAIEARMRAALYQVGGSYPAIELSQDAARAAGTNLELVTDSYSKGAVSVTDLIDAQDAALAAELAAAEAEYAFLIDYMEVLRARGSYDLVLEPQKVSPYYDSISDFFRERGVSPLGQ
ncbi:MAG: TolC family protein [Gammaproteobacteria bacterium]|nr:TolC family protein [Gammaproteobacteria bacterium]NNF61432.1 TolC family protein [Gammaproteobacteria bacterium]NNM20193.1 TolC family protein [Gammaproteobacteria bacterium]